MKEMFYLTSHSTHFIFGYMAAVNRYSERGNPFPPLGLLSPIMHHPTDRIAHTTACVILVAEHWLE